MSVRSSYKIRQAKEAFSKPPTSFAVRRFSAVELDQDIGERIRFLREVSGLTQRRIARQFGLSCQQFYKYEAGKNRVSAALLYELSKMFGVSTEWFFGAQESDVFCEEICSRRQYEAFLDRVFKVYWCRKVDTCDLAIQSVRLAPILGAQIPDISLNRIYKIVRNGPSRKREEVVCTEARFFSLCEP